MTNSSSSTKSDTFIRTIPRGLPVYIFGHLYSQNSMGYLTRALAQQLRDCGYKAYVVTDEDPSKFPYFYVGYRYRKDISTEWRKDLKGEDYISIGIMDSALMNPFAQMGRCVYQITICDDDIWKDVRFQNYLRRTRPFSISDFSARFVERKTGIPILHWRVPVKRLPYGMKFELTEFPHGHIYFANTTWRQIPRDLRIMLSVASPQPRKNWHKLLTAFAHVTPDMLLWLHAPTTTWGSVDWIKPLINELYTKTNSPLLIVTTEEFGEAYIDAMYRRANYYISVSEMEGLGIPVIRAKQEGCKVVAVPHGGFTEHIEVDYKINYKVEDGYAKVNESDIADVIATL